MNNASIGPQASIANKGSVPLKPEAESSFFTKGAGIAVPADASSTDRTDCHIIALADVGWGNTMYMRGEGAGLRWDTGTPMCCAGDDRWVFTHSANNPPSGFKFLRNDIDWALGENHSSDGKEISIYAPHFPPC